MEEIEPLSEAEVSIFMCRMQGAVFDNDVERIKKIQAEIRERLKQLNYYPESLTWEKLKK